MVRGLLGPYVVRPPVLYSAPDSSPSHLFDGLAAPTTRPSPARGEEFALHRLVRKPDLLIGELAIGFVLGLSVRMVVAGLQTAGSIVAQQLGLSFAMTVDPAMGGQQAAIGNLLTLLGLTLIFTADVHHLAIAAIRDSYGVLPPAGVPSTGDAAALAVRAAGRGFALAVQIAAPFIAFAILFNLGIGVLSRLMPQLQVFFLAMPATILVGMLVLLAVIGVMMGVFVQDLGAFLRELGGR